MDIQTATEEKPMTIEDFLYFKDNVEVEASRLTVRLKRNFEQTRTNEIIIGSFFEMIDMAMEILPAAEVEQYLVKKCSEMGIDYDGEGNDY